MAWHVAAVSSHPAHPEHPKPVPVGWACRSKFEADALVAEWAAQPWLSHVRAFSTRRAADAHAAKHATA